MHPMEATFETPMKCVHAPVHIHCRSGGKTRDLYFELFCTVFLLFVAYGSTLSLVVDKGNRKTLVHMGEQRDSITEYGGLAERHVT